MKNLLLGLVLLSACAPNAVITSVKPLPSNQCLYEVTKDTVVYNFIDDCDKYAVGQTVK